jgi:hypothetical protein
MTCVGDEKRETACHRKWCSNEEEPSTIGRRSRGARQSQAYSDEEHHRGCEENVLRFGHQGIANCLNEYALLPITWVSNE